MEWWPDRAGRQHLYDSNHGSPRTGRMDRLEPTRSGSGAGRHIGNKSLRSIAVYSAGQQLKSRLLKACRNCFCQGPAGIIVIQRPHIGAAQLVLPYIGRLRGYRSGIIVGIEGSGGRIVDRRSDSCRIVPNGVPVLVDEVLDGLVGQKASSQQGVATQRSGRLARIRT
jgi:hypothetical protein